jgi:sugar phosphate isomerase/epimerase
MNNPILVSTIAFDGYDVDTTFAGMAAAGVENIELAYSEAYTAPVTEDTFSREAALLVLDKLAANGLNCPCLAAHTDMSLPNSVEKFRRRIDFAKYLGAGYVVSTAGPIANRDQFLKNIEALGKYAGEVGITICLENMGDGRPNIIDSAAPAVQLIKEINLPAVKINYDFANLLPHLAERLRPEEDYRIALPQAGYFHVKDAAKDSSGNWYFPSIGAGTIDFKSILPALAAHPEPIPLSLELSLRITRLPDATPVRAEQAVPLETIGQALAESLRFVKQYLSV